MEPEDGHGAGDVFGGEDYPADQPGGPGNGASSDAELDAIFSAGDAGDVQPVEPKDSDEPEELGSNRRRRRTSGKTDYNTDQEVLDCIAKLGPIACDPFWNERCLVKAKVCWTEQDDSLTRLIPEGITFANPPYGAFLTKLLPVFLIWMTLPKREIFLYVPGSSDMEWFKEIAKRVPLVLCFRGRRKFSGAKEGAFFNSVLLCHTKRPEKVIEAFRGIAYPMGYIHRVAK